MKMKINEQEKNPTKEKDNDIENENQESDLSSLLNEKIITKINKRKYSVDHSYNPFELSNIKNLSTIFFVIFIVTIISMSVQSISNINHIPFSSISTRKNNFTFFSFYFSIQNPLMKFTTIINQCVLLLLIWCLFSLFNQRMSVPEYSNNKNINILCFISTLMSTLCIFTLTFYYNETKILFKNIGIVDNGIFTILLLSLILMCLFSYFALKVVITFEEAEKNKTILKGKEFIIGAMISSFIVYFLCLVIVSVFVPSSYNENILISVLIVAMEISAIAFMGSFALFEISLRFDIEYVYNGQKKRPDVEYFFEDTSAYIIDFDE